MKYILSFILVFLLSLPNCGVVFAGTMNKSMDHSMGSHMSMWESDNNGDIQETRYNCCPNSNGESIRNIVTASSEVKTISSIPHISPSPLPLEDLLQPSFVNYRPNAPPDPWEYCSLVGSVKRLD